MYNLTVYTYLAPSKVCDRMSVFSLVDIPQDTVIFKPKGSIFQITDVSPEIQNYLKKMTIMMIMVIGLMMIYNG